MKFELEVYGCNVLKSSHFDFFLYKYIIIIDKHDFFYILVVLSTLLVQSDALTERALT